MCAYDTTLDEVTTPPQAAPRKKLELRPEGPRVDWFPQTSGAALAVVVVLCAAFLFTSFNRINHTDSWGHLALGRWIVEHGGLPSADPIGAAARPDAKFINVGWLSQVAGYAAHALGGSEGLVLGHAALVTLACGFIVWAVRRRGVPLAWAAAAGLAAYVLALPVLGTIRPQLFGLAFFPLVLLACAELPGRRHPLFWLPALFALWSNLHGSFAAGLVAFGAYCAGMSFELYREAGGWRGVVADGRMARLWLALALAVAGSCLHPSGPMVLWHAATFGSHPALAEISEWRPLVVSSFSGVLFFASMLVSALLLRASPRRLRAYEVAMILVFAALACSAIRMLAWWAIVWVWVAWPHAVAVWDRWRRGVAEEAVAVALGDAPAAAPTTVRTLIALACVFMTLLVAPPTHALIAGQGRGEGAIVSDDTPLYVADEIVRRQLAGRFFAPIDWSDYLVWRSAGRLKPLAYTHVHLLPPPVWTDQRHVMAGGRNWLRVADHYQLDYLVVSVERNAALRESIFRNSRARVVYQDQQAMLVKILPPPAKAPAEKSADATKTDAAE